MSANKSNIKKRIPIIILILAPYIYLGLGVYFLLNRGGLSEKALVPIIYTFVVFLLAILIPCLIYFFFQIKNGFTPKEMMVSGSIIVGTMIPIWVISIIVSVAMATTILLSVLIPLIVVIDCAFTIPGILLIIIGGIRYISSKVINKK